MAWCDDLACSGATITTLDSEGRVGSWTSLAFHADGRALISYRKCGQMDKTTGWECTFGDLKVALCDDAACSSTLVTTLDSGGDVGEYAGDVGEYL